MDPNTIIKTGEQLGASSDRTLFLTAIALCFLGGVWAIRYLVVHIKYLEEKNEKAHTDYANRLEQINERSSRVVEENTKATTEQSVLLRHHTEIMKAAARRLETDQKRD